MVLAVQRTMRLYLLAAAILIACGGNTKDSDSGSSGGASGAGRGGSTGGSSAGSGAAGKGGSGGSKPDVCGPTLTFTLDQLEGAEFCIGKPGSCTSDWFQILDAVSGEPVTTDLGCGGAECPSCDSFACPTVCAISTSLVGLNLETTWEGVNWLPGTCAGGGECRSPSCVAPGEYIARFCGYALGPHGPGVTECELLGAMEPTCVDVHFPYPSAGSVDGVLE